MTSPASILPQPQPVPAVLPRLHLPRPFQPDSPVSRLVQSLWFLPTFIAAVFVIGIAIWANLNDALEQEEIRQTLIADTLSLTAQLSGRLEVEQARLDAVAARLPARAADGDRVLASLPEVAGGLDHLWMSLVWLDASNQVVGQVRRTEASGSARSALARSQQPGQTLHLVAMVGGPKATSGSRLVARYDPADLLKSNDFWWLAHKYDVDLVSDLGEVIASTAQQPGVAKGDRFSKAFEPYPDAVLRLTRIESQAAWYASQRTLVLIFGVVALSLVATLLLRREMRRASGAELDWRTEAAWRQAMEESALVGLRARDLKGRILYVNRTLCEMVGYAQHELEGLVPPLPFWPSEERDQMMQSNQRTLAGESPTEGFEARWQHRSGRILDVVIFESPLVDNTGRHIGWMGSIVDVTERKRLEDIERRQIETLAHHARLTTMGEVGSTLAHELNQPLTSIVSYSAGLLLALKKQTLSDPELLDVAEEIRKQAAQAGRIVHRIRSRVARRDPVPEECDVNAVVADALDLLARLLSHSRIKLDMELTAGLPNVRIDRVGIEQVVTNLVRNAADELAGATQQPQIVIRTRLLGASAAGTAVDQVVIDVIDNGPGLQGRTLETLTTTFYSTKNDGMGMGLAICRSIVQSHQGVLSAQDAPGGGAHFSCSLPVAAQPKVLA